MVETENELVDRLLAENEEYKGLHSEHKELKSKVEELTQKKYLSPEEDIELKQIKKLKLAGKDRMEKIRSEAKEAAGP